MDVSFKKRSLVAALAFSLAACAGESDAEPSQQEVLAYVSQRVAAATAELGQRIEVCNEKARSNRTPELEPGRLEELNAEPQDIVVALGHFNYVNSFQCERDARLALAYEVGTLSSAKRRLNKDWADLEAVQSGLLYPSLDVLQYSVNYSKLNPALRQYFEEAIGTEPFSLGEALEENAELLATEN
jgi:hypothetical protein